MPPRLQRRPSWQQVETYVVDYVKGAPTCRSCGDRIPVGYLRFGVIYQHSDGFIIMKWHHLRCAPAPHSLRLTSQLEGFGKLHEGAKATVRRWVAGEEVTHCAGSKPRPAPVSDLGALGELDELVESPKGGAAASVQPAGAAPARPDENSGKRPPPLAVGGPQKKLSAGASPRSPLLPAGQV